VPCGTSWPLDDFDFCKFFAGRRGILKDFGPKGALRFECFWLRRIGGVNGLVAKFCWRRGFWRFFGLKRP